MSAITQQSPTQFAIRFDALVGLLRRVLGGRPPTIDPYLIGQAIVEVMRRCAMRSAAGRPMLWNEYRVILAHDDFAQLWSLQTYLQRDLEAVLAAEAQRLGAHLIGELCVHVIADEASELAIGRGVIRVGFTPTPQLAAPARGEMTVRLGAIKPDIGRGATAAGELTVQVSEPTSLDDAAWSPYHLTWPGGSADFHIGVRTIVGRPHPSHPPQFVPLTGAGARINKQHIWIVAMTSRAVVGRPGDANPVHLDGALLGAGEERELAQPEVEISLSRGELVLRLHRSESSA